MTSTRPADYDIFNTACLLHLIGLDLNANICLIKHICSVKLIS